MAIPNMTGTDAENLGGFDPTPARYAAVQIWTNKYIAPTPSNLDKFVKLNSNGDPVMVSPSVATTEFGKPDYIYNGTPGAFVNNRGTAVGDEVINGTIGDNIIGVAAPK
jgi:ribosomal protein L21E